MKVYGQLEYAQFHNASADLTPVSAGLAYYNTASGVLKYYDSVAAAWQTLVTEAAAPSLNSAAPVGSIVAYNPGYYTGGGNAGFTTVGPAGNTVAQVNTFLPANWRVCNGAALNDSGSTIFNGAGRYLPDLTDDRFLMGDTLAGGTGGSNTNSHTHSVTSNVSVAAHSITQPEFNQISHQHTVTVGFTSGQITQPQFTVDAHRHNISHVHPWGYFTASSIRLSNTNDVDNVDLSSGANDSAVFTRLVGSLAGGGSEFPVTTAWSNGTYYTGGVHTDPEGANGADAGSGLATVNTTTRTVPTSISDVSFQSGIADPDISRTTDVALSAHSVTNNAVTSGAPSDTENRPKYLSTFYIMRVK